MRSNKSIIYYDYTYRAYNIAMLIIILCVICSPVPYYQPGRFDTLHCITSIADRLIYSSSCNSLILDQPQTINRIRMAVNASHCLDCSLHQVSRRRKISLLVWWWFKVTDIGAVLIQSEVNKSRVPCVPAHNYNDERTVYVRGSNISHTLRGSLAHFTLKPNQSRKIRRATSSSWTKQFYLRRRLGAKRSYLTLVRVADRIL